MTHDDPEPTPADNTEGDTNTLVAVPDYAITKVDNLAGPAVPGQTFQYTFTLADYDLFFFDPLISEADLGWTLEGQGGVVEVSDWRFGFGPLFPELVPGDYTLTIDPENSARSR